LNQDQAGSRFRAIIPDEIREAGRAGLLPSPEMPLGRSLALA
jgi:hypothetical protein